MSNRYTKHQLAFIEKNYKGITYEELRQRFNKEFNTKKSRDTITQLCHRHGWYNGVKSKDTQFKKGTVSPKAKPIGSEMVTYRGTVLVKYRIKGERPDGKDTWKPKSIYVWEQHYGVDLPSDELIIFLDGNNRNFDIDNLLPIKRKEFLIMGKQKLFTEYPELTLAGLYYIRLKSLRRKKERELLGRIPRT